MTLNLTQSESLYGYLLDDTFDPKVDFAFKLVLGSPDHPQITIHFLNAVTFRRAAPTINCVPRSASACWTV